jgi:hypothetical protein
MDERLIGPSGGRAAGIAGGRSLRQPATRRLPRGGGAARRPAGTQQGKAASAAASREYDRPRPAGTAPRTPFALLVLGLLGGGLVCLLVINTTLGAASFKISELQQAGTTLAQQEQTLQSQVSTLANPAQVERRAYQLGMRPMSKFNWRDLEIGTAAARKVDAHRSASRPGSGR